MLTRDKNELFPVTMNVGVESLRQRFI